MCAVNLFAAVFIALFALSTGEPIENASGIINGGGTIQLTFLGTVEGKSYFYENTLRNWKVAQTFCTTTGMHLATITTSAQWDFLAGAYAAGTFAETYWISLRDAQEPRQFLWDVTEMEPSDSIGLVWDNANNPVLNDFLTCVTFNANVNPTLSALNIDNCVTPRKVLCET